LHRQLLGLAGHGRTAQRALLRGGLGFGGFAALLGRAGVVGGGALRLGPGTLALGLGLGLGLRLGLLLDGGDDEGAAALGGAVPGLLDLVGLLEAVAVEVALLGPVLVLQLLLLELGVRRRLGGGLGGG